MYSYWRLKHQLLDVIAANCTDIRHKLTVQTEKVLSMWCKYSESEVLTQSFLLDPSFLNSFLPLEKKPVFFFFPCTGQSVCAGLSVGGGPGGEQQPSTADETGAVFKCDVRLVVGVCWGRGSVWSFMSGDRGSVWGCKTSSSVEVPGSCGSVEDGQVS